MPTGQLTRAIQHLRRILGAPAGSDLTDRQLLDRFAECKDEDAFTTLVQRHGPLVWGVCRRLLANDADAEDAFQATFWILARKASSIQWHESVANWLYGVAFRTAQRARTKADLRRQHEQQAGAMIPTSADTPPDWQELRIVLDEELMSLPAKYRLPLLLCYLHGKTRDEAAEELGWSTGALKGCLERGREMLRGRLARRGLTLSAALLPTLLAAGAVAAPPASLVMATVNAVSAGTLSAPVVALSKGVMQAMFWTKIKTAMLLMAAIGMVGLIGAGAGLGAYSALAVKGDAAVQAPAPMAEVPEPPVEARGQQAPADGVEADLQGLPKAVQGRSLEEQAAFIKKVATRYRPKEGVRVLKTPDGKVELAVAAENTSISKYTPTATVLTVLVAGDGVNPYAGRLIIPAGAPSSVAGGSIHLAAMPPSGLVFALSGDGSPSGFNAGGGACGVVTAGDKSCYDGPFRNFVGQDPAKVRAGAAHGRGFLVVFSCNPLEAAPAGVQEAKASEPAVKDGLSVTVKPAKAVFAADEALELQVTYTNVGKTPFVLKDADYLWNREVEFEDVQTKLPWVLRPLFRCITNNTLTTLEPGKSLEARLVLNPASTNYRYEFASPIPDGKVERKQARLAAGSYRVTVGLEFVAEEKAAEGMPRTWAGKIATTPVDFAIADAKPAAEEKPAPPKPQVKDAASGITVTVKDDNRTVIATDAAGKMIWFTDLAAVKGVVGQPVVRQLTLQDGKVTATYGKHTSVVIDLKTGKVISISSD